MLTPRRSWLIRRAIGTTTYDSASAKLRAPLPSRTTATRRGIQRSKNGKRHARRVERCDQSVSQCQSQRSDFLVAAWICDQALLNCEHLATTAQHAKEFHVFHDRDIRKSSQFDEIAAPAKESVI